MKIIELYKKITDVKDKIDFAKHEDFIRLLKILEQDATTHNINEFEKIYCDIKKSESDN